jgi:heptosyltransferase II
LLARQSRIPERWGFRADLRTPLLTRAVEKPRASRLHQAEYYQHLTRTLGIAPGPLVADVRVDAEHRVTADRLLREHGWDDGPLVGIAPGAAYGWAKRWPPDRVGALAARLARDAGASVVLVGAAADQDTVAEVTRAAFAAGAGARNIIDLAGKTDLPALAGVLARCRAFVSNDSGAMHLAAAVDVPVVGIFGPTREWATSPLPGPHGIRAAIVRTDVWCRPCMLRTCPIDHRCMTGIGVEDVISPVLAMLRAPRARIEAP